MQLTFDSAFKHSIKNFVINCHSYRISNSMHIRYLSLGFFPNSARCHWLLQGHMTPNSMTSVGNSAL